MRCMDYDDDPAGCPTEAVMLVDIAVGDATLEREVDRGDGPERVQVQLEDQRIGYCPVHGVQRGLNALLTPGRLVAKGSNGRAFPPAHALAEHYEWRVG